MELREGAAADKTPSTADLIELRHPDLHIIMSQTRFAPNGRSEARATFVDLTTTSLNTFLRFRWQLTPSEFNLAQEAMSFVDQRYAELGITDLPKVFGPFIYKHVDFWDLGNRNSKHTFEDLEWSQRGGRGSAIYRVLGVQEQSGVSLEFPSDFACKIAHEYTHALGSVRVSLRGLQEKGPDLSGFSINTTNNRKLFSCLEEYVAEWNSHGFLLSRDGISEIRGPSDVEFGPGPVSAAQQEAIIEVANRLELLLRDKRCKVIPSQLEAQYYKVMADGKPYAYQTGYGVNNASIRALAAEIFEGHPDDEAISLFSNQALIAQITGNYQSFFKLIKSKLGTRGLKVLAFCDPTGDSSTENGFSVNASSVLLSLYAAARKLPLEERESVRDLISVAIDPRGTSKA